MIGILAKYRRDVRGGIRADYKRLKKHITACAETTKLRLFVPIGIAGPAAPAHQSAEIGGDVTAKIYAVRRKQAPRISGYVLPGKDILADE
jgi:hypothetical protein